MEGVDLVVFFDGIPSGIPHLKQEIRPLVGSELPLGWGQPPEQRRAIHCPIPVLRVEQLRVRVPPHRVQGPLPVPEAEIAHELLDQDLVSGASGILDLLEDLLEGPVLLAVGAARDPEAGSYIPVVTERAVKARAEDAITARIGVALMGQLVDEGEGPL